MAFVLDCEGKTAQTTIPIQWPENLQPEWLKKLSTLFKQGAIQIVPSPSQRVGNERRKGGKPTEGIVDHPHSSHDTAIFEESDSANVEAVRMYNGASEETSNEAFPEQFPANVESSQSLAKQSAHPQQSKSRGKLRVEKGVQSLCDPEARDNTLRALVEAINSDFKQRLFMHQDKLRELQALISRRDLSIPEIFGQLVARLGDQHSHLVALVASLVSQENLPTLQPYQEENVRKAYTRAWEMIVLIQTYLAGSRSKPVVRNAFKNIKEALDPSAEEKMSSRLKQLFGVRDDPLWRLLRTQIPNERFCEKVEDWEFECIDMDKLQEEEGQLHEKFEIIRLPSPKFEPADRGRLRLRHGRITVEHNGRLKNVSIGIVGESSS